MSDDSLQWLQAVQGVFEGSQWGHAFRWAMKFLKMWFWCFANLMIWFCCYCCLWNVFSWRWYIYRTRSWNKDKYESPQLRYKGPFKTWGPSSQSILTFQASFTHYNLFKHIPMFVCFFSHIYKPIFCFLLNPPAKPPKKPLKPQIHRFFQVSCRNSTWTPWKVFLGSRDIVWILDGFHWTEKFG